MKKEIMSNGKTVYVFENKATIEDVREFETQPITANKVGGVVRVTVDTNIRNSFENPHPDWHVEKINETLSVREETFVISWENPDWDGLEYFIRQRFDEGLSLWFDESEYLGASSKVLTYDKFKGSVWASSPCFTPDMPIKKVTNIIYKRMFGSCFDA